MNLQVGRFLAAHSIHHGPEMRDVWQATQLEGPGLGPGLASTILEVTAAVYIDFRDCFVSHTLHAYFSLLTVKYS
jgi:hypothetical protein